MSIRGAFRGVPTLAVAGLLLAVAACSSGSAGSPAAAPSSASTTAAPASGPLQAVDLTVPGGLDASPLDQARTVQAPTGWSVSVFARLDGARLLAWTPDGRLLVSRPKAGEVDVLTPAAGDGTATPTTTSLLSGLDQPHGLAFRGNRLYVAQSDEVDAYAYADGRASDPTVVAGGLPDAKSPDLRGAYAHALKSVAVGPDGAVVHLGRLHREHLCRGPRRGPAAGHDPAGAAGRRPGRGLRPGRPERDRPGGGPGRGGLDGREQPRQRRVPVRPGLRRRRFVRPGPGRARLRRRPPVRAPGPPHAGPRPRLAVLQPRPRRRSRHARDGPRLREPPVRAGRGDERGRLEAGLRHAASGRAGDGGALRAARPQLHRRAPGCPPRTAPAPWSASTGPGTGPRPARPKCRSSPTATARWATSRRSSPGSRAPTATVGAAPSPRSRARTAPSTSATTSPGPCTGCSHPPEPPRRWRRPMGGRSRSAPRPDGRPVVAGRRTARLRPGARWPAHGARP